MAEFERRELLKMRVHHALRKASTAILARFFDSKKAQLFREHGTES